MSVHRVFNSSTHPADVAPTLAGLARQHPSGSLHEIDLGDIHAAQISTGIREMTDTRLWPEHNRDDMIALWTVADGHFAFVQPATRTVMAVDLRDERFTNWDTLRYAGQWGIIVANETGLTDDTWPMPTVPRRELGHPADRLIAACGFAQVLMLHPEIADSATNYLLQVALETAWDIIQNNSLGLAANKDRHGAVASALFAHLRDLVERSSMTPQPAVAGA